MHEGRDDGVGKVGEQDANHDVDLEQADQSPTPLCRCQLRNVHGPKHGRATDTEPAKKASHQKEIPVGRKCTAQCREQVEQPHDAQGCTTANALA